jgi:hypothetical protein
MKLAAVVLCSALAACACKGGSQPPSGPGPGTGGGSGSTVGDPAACAGLTPHLEDLYRAEATRTHKPAATPEAVPERDKAIAVEVADNVAMVVAECKTAPTRIVACVTKATAVAVIEQRCLAAVDDDGSEGDQFLRK